MSRYPFDCELCPYEQEYRTRLGGAFMVFWHYFSVHGEEMEEAGFMEAGTDE